MSTLSAEEFYRASRSALLVDVRSPSEYSSGHICGSVNVPLFEDQERAAVGTTYKNEGRKQAVLQGLDFVGPKMASFVRQTNQLREKYSPEKDEVYVHCWRGGMRSQSFAWLLETAGIPVHVLDGGYKSFRKIAHRRIGHRHNMIVLSGLTGAGKTEILKLLSLAGEQIVNLEGLANHRGSSFGAIGLGEQPSTEQFENRLFESLDSVDPSKRFWVEDEGSRLGHVVVPPRFVKQVRRAPAIFLDVPLETRLDNLLVEYGELNRESLVEATRGIQKRLGGKNMIDTIQAIENGDLRRAAEITLSYYDRSYLKAKSGMPRKESVNLPTQGLDKAAIVEQLASLAETLAPNNLARPKQTSQI